jgi:sortase, SrtB family
MREATYKWLIRKGIRLLESTIYVMVLLPFMGCIAFGVYAIWDSNQLYAEADAKAYEQYKPRNQDTRSFAELQAINEEVIGWLQVYGTNIDYPLVQADNNEKYVNMSVSGEAVLSGAIFLDYRNQADFSDFNTIIYGHHMNNQVMFGEIGEFQDETYFKERQYGKIHDGQREYGIEFFAFLETDGYDRSVYMPAITEVDRQQEYLANILERALHTRDIEAVTMDIADGEMNRWVLLSTCTTRATNGRHILIGRISDTVYEDTFIKEGLVAEFGNENNLWSNQVIYAMLFALIVIGILLTKKYKPTKERRWNDTKRRGKTKDRSMVMWTDGLSRNPISKCRNNSSRNRYTSYS